MQVQSARGVAFASGLRTIVGADRDIIMEPYLVASPLECVIGQRLVRRLCRRPATVPGATKPAVAEGMRPLCEAAWRRSGRGRPRSPRSRASRADGRGDGARR